MGWVTVKGSSTMFGGINLVVVVGMLVIAVARAGVPSVATSRQTVANRMTKRFMPARVSCLLR